MRIRTVAINRPESTPTLVLERFREEGNSEGVVVHLPEKKLLLHKGRHYAARGEIPEDAEILDLFEHEDGAFLILKLKHSSIWPNPQQRTCEFIAMPDEEQKAKLTTVYQKHGENMAEITERMTADFKRIKSLFSTLATDVNAICPGYRPMDKLNEGFHDYNRDNDEATELPLEDSDELDEMHDSVEAILKGALELATLEPFSRKRKASGDDVE